MTDTPDHLGDLVRIRYRRAALSCVPMFCGLVLVLIETFGGAHLVSPGVSFAIVLAGIILAALPVTLYARAKTALDREKKMAQLAELASAFEVNK